MANIFIWLIAISTVITSIVSFAKPAYKKFAGDFTVSINILLSFILWEIASFSVVPLFELEFNTGLLILLGLALWTGSNIFYDVWKLFRSAAKKLESK